MKDTRFFLPPAERERLAADIRAERRSVIRAPEGPRTRGALEGPRRSFAGGAGCSTARDYARFLEMTATAEH